ncbi:MAG: hypothetical protein EXR99_14290 [Gemmataceae bacterium]|nr:hypothetical protein [Gemmataceae bacterium]
MRIPPLLLLLVLAWVLGCGEKSPPVVPPDPVPPKIQINSVPSTKEKDALAGLSALGEYVSFPSAGVKIRQPKRFDKAENFAGFAREEDQASIMAVKITGPVEELVAGFTEAKLKKQNWKLLDKEPMMIDGLQGILIHFEQPAAGRRFIKWALAFGDREKTYMVTAAFSQEMEGEFSSLLRSAVVSSREEKSGTAEQDNGVPFTLGTPKSMKPVHLVSMSLGFAKDGVVPLKSPKDALFVAAPSVEKPVLGNRKSFAELRIRQSAQVREMLIESTKPVTIDELEGFETIASCQDEKSGEKLVVYQVLLFQGDSYFVLQGMAGQEKRAEYLEEFRELAKTFKRKAKKEK